MCGGAGCSHNAVSLVIHRPDKNLRGTMPPGDTPHKRKLPAGAAGSQDKDATEMMMLMCIMKIKFSGACTVMSTCMRLCGCAMMYQQLVVHVMGLFLCVCPFFVKYVPIS